MNGSSETGMDCSQADIRNPLRYLLESVKIQDRFLLL